MLGWLDFGRPTGAKKSFYEFRLQAWPPFPATLRQCSLLEMS